MIFFIITTNEIKFKDGDFKEKLINAVKEKNGLCSPIDNDYISNSSLVCLLPNSQNLQDIKSQF